MTTALPHLPDLPHLPKLPDARDSARLALACLDPTRLNDSDDTAAIAALCQRALGPAGQPAALCVWPRFVAQARAALPAAVRLADRRDQRSPATGSD